MKNSRMKKLAASLLAGFVCMTSVPMATNFNANALQHFENIDGYNYELWSEYDDDVKMQYGPNGTYSCQWNNSHNCLFRAGKKFTTNTNWADLNGITVDYSCNYKPNGNSYLCVYGWTRSPLVEYYIVDSYGTWRPPGEGPNMKKMGTITVDGAQYEVYSGTHDGPSIETGVTHFNQYWSVRVGGQLRTEGVIDVSKHFAAWEKFGMKMGNLAEVALNVEGWESSGQAEVTKNVLTIGGGTYEEKPVEPDENGNFFSSGFESGKDNWSSRGDAVISNDTKNYYSGKQSLYVSGRKDNWHGAAINLDPSAFKAGNTYSFNTAVLQNSGSDVEMQLTLQYNIGEEAHYDKVDSVTAKSGEWTKLGNSKFTIPEGATGLLLYVEAPESLTDFYIDDATGSVEGTVSKVVTGGGTVDAAFAATTTTTAPATTTKAVTTTVTTAAPVVTTTEAPVSNRKYGDANIDGDVSAADAVTILQYLGNRDKYPLTEEGILNADVYDCGDGVTAMDALTIQKYDAGILKELPESYSKDYKPVATTAAPETAAKPATTIPETTTVPVTTKVEFTAKFFSNGEESAVPRGDVTILPDTNNFYSGDSSVKVSGRTKAWQGLAQELDSSYTPGGTYSFSAAVLQGSGADEEMRLTLQYTDASGKTQYDNIAAEKVADKTWTKLENTAYTIPEGATDLVLYVETDSSLTDFYVDEFTAAKAGTESKVVTGKGTVNITASSAFGGVDTSWIDPSKPMVAISFDDGAKGSSPTASSMRIINAIADSKFHATFFYVGDWIKGTDGETEVKYAYSKGMEIANHTYTHPELPKKSASEIRKEYDDTAAKLRSIINAEPSKLLRLPYLACDDKVKSTLYDVPLITCSIDTQDWKGASSDAIINTIKTAMNNGSLNGSIVLCHETYDATAEAMEYLAPYLKSQGWQIVTVSEMFAVKGQQLNGGTVYTRVN